MLRCLSAPKPTATPPHPFLLFFTPFSPCPGPGQASPTAFPPPRPLWPPDPGLWEPQQGVEQIHGGPQDPTAGPHSPCPPSAASVWAVLASLPGCRPPGPAAKGWERLGSLGGLRAAAMSCVER